MFVQIRSLKKQQENSGLCLIVTIRAFSHVKCGGKRLVSVRLVWKTKATRIEFPKTTKKKPTKHNDKYAIWGQLTLLLSVSLSHMLGSRFSDFLHISSPFTKRACFISVCVSIMFSKVPTWIEANKSLGSNFTTVIGRQWQSAIYQLLVFHWETKEARS